MVAATTFFLKVKDKFGVIRDGRYEGRTLEGRKVLITADGTKIYTMDETNRLFLVGSFCWPKLVEGDRGVRWEQGVVPKWFTDSILFGEVVRVTWTSN